MIKPSPYQADATISECGRFRYRLGRWWAVQHPRLLFVMLNPSTADAMQDDPTIRRCIGFAQRAGFGGLQVVNLFAYRATDPRDLRLAGWPVGPENDEHIVTAARESEAVCVAWGAIGTGNPAEARVQIVMPQLRSAGLDPKCLRITRSGYPQHPLMLPSSCTLQPFDESAVQEATN